MKDMISSILLDWSSRRNERLKLQQAYLVATVALIVFAGLITLLNPSLGRQLIMVAGFVLAVFLTNGVAWALLEAFLIRKLDAKTPTVRKKR